MKKLILPILILCNSLITIDNTDETNGEKPYSFFDHLKFWQRINKKDKTKDPSKFFGKYLTIEFEPTKDDIEFIYSAVSSHKITDKFAPKDKQFLFHVLNKIEKTNPDYHFNLISDSISKNIFTPEDKPFIINTIKNYIKKDTPDFINKAEHLLHEATYESILTCDDELLFINLIKEFLYNKNYTSPLKTGNLLSTTHYAVKNNLLLNKNNIIHILTEIAEESNVQRRNYIDRIRSLKVESITIEEYIKEYNKIEIKEYNKIQKDEADSIARIFEKLIEKKIIGEDELKTFLEHMNKLLNDMNE